jgi:hypothetical protein
LPISIPVFVRYGVTFFLPLENVIGECSIV